MMGAGGTTGGGRHSPGMQISALLILLIGTVLCSAQGPARYQLRAHRGFRRYVAPVYFDSALARYDDVADYRRFRRQEPEQYEPASYGFAYQVKDHRGNDYSHQEAREGPRTRGRYSVLLPDGRRQIVDYVADEAGFRPTISYETVQAAPAYPLAY